VGRTAKLLIALEFEALHMIKWVSDDPALEVGQQLNAPRVNLELPK
jgi:hypothetical protein